MNIWIKALFALILFGDISQVHLDAMKRGLEEDDKERAVGLDGRKRARTSLEQDRVMLGERPATVQQAVDNAFEKQKDRVLASWGGEYCSRARYDLFFNEQEIPAWLVSKPNNEIYIIDVGCASGLWGQHLMNKLLQNPACQKSDKKFYIFSITGGLECERLDKIEGNVILHQFNQIKCENIDEELLANGFDLRGKVDLIVSSMTIQFFVDPFGTIKRIYDLLTPLGGILLCDSFASKSDKDEIQFPSRKNCEVLVTTNAVILLQIPEWTFLLMKNDNRALEIPLEYTDKMFSLSYWLPDVAVVDYIKGDIHQESAHLIRLSETPAFMPGYYCCDLRGKALYEDLRRYGLISY